MSKDIINSANLLPEYFQTDKNAKFLYVLSGKKTVYLISPIYSHNLYFKEFNIVPKIFNKN